MHLMCNSQRLLRHEPWPALCTLLLCLRADELLGKVRRNAHSHVVMIEEQRDCPQVGQHHAMTSSTCDALSARGQIATQRFGMCIILCAKPCVNIFSPRALTETYVIERT